MKLYSPPSALAPSAKHQISRERITKRHRIDRWFRRGGLLMVMICLLVLFSIVGRLAYQGGSVLWKNEVELPITFSSTVMSVPEKPTEMEIREGDTAALWHKSLLNRLYMPDAPRQERRQIYRLVSAGAAKELTQLLLENPNRLEKVESVRLPLSSEADGFLKTEMSRHVVTRTYHEPLSALPTNSEIEITLNQPLFAAHMPSKISIHEGITTLDRETESVFLAFNGGIIKLEQMAANTAKGEVLVPFSTPLNEGRLNQIGAWEIITYSVPEQGRGFKDRSFAALYALQQQGLIYTTLNNDFFSKGDSRNPEMAGIWGAIMGSFLTLLVCFAASFPIGVAAAVYLEEFSGDSRAKRLLEVNINNLAAIPAIIYGLLGVAVFLNGFGLPRSAPLVGGLVLSLKTLPVIIISTRAALKAVPLSIRQAAWALGATPMQTVFHHVVPLALPGIMTGTILGLSHALGETAPLLMIGMVAFIADVPYWFTEAASVLPVQIYLWADSPEKGFVEKTAAAILVLLVFMMVMNAIAIFIRRRFERRW